MATKQIASWFFGGPANRFKANDKPVQSTFETLTLSFLNILEGSATTTKPGIVVLANAPHPGDTYTSDNVQYPIVATSEEVNIRIQAALGTTFSTQQPTVINNPDLAVSKVNLVVGTPNSYLKTTDDGTTVEWGDPVLRTTWQDLPFTVGSNFQVQPNSYIEYRTTYFTNNVLYTELRGVVNLKVITTDFLSGTAFTISAVPVTSISKEMFFPIYANDLSIADLGVMPFYLKIGTNSVCTVSGNVPALGSLPSPLSPNPLPIGYQMQVGFAIQIPNN